MNKLSVFLGEIARPFAIIVTSIGACWASIVTSYRVEDGTDGALLIAAIFVGVTGLYGFKAVEMWKGRQSDATVEIAKAEAKK